MKERDRERERERERERTERVTENTEKGTNFLKNLALFGNFQFLVAT